MRMKKHLLLLTGILAAGLMAQAQELPGGALNGERYRIFISTDIGGYDDDDYQSLAHIFLYGDLFDIEGIIASPPGPGTEEHIHKIIDLYEADYPKLARYSDQIERLKKYIPKESARNRTTAGGDTNIELWHKKFEYITGKEIEFMDW